MTAPLALCDARIFHARLGARPLRFRYDMLSILIDLDRLAEAGRVSPFFSVGRFNLLGFDPRDHGPCDGASLRAHVDALHAAHGMPAPARLILSCFPRILGFVFNPLAVYVGFDPNGRATSALYEVRNTFGERHSYFFPLACDARGRPAPHECDKIFYVSPFIDMAQRYRFVLTAPQAEVFGLKIIERDRSGVQLTALIEATPFEATRAAILRRLAATPLLGFKALAGIHWQALKLWRLGHRLQPRPPPPPPVSLAAPGPYSSTSASETT
ncbi:MAG: DUF1365 domain-containing protein [Methylobacteriaceae bacterium]|nr:DUF1365 domain-containing protein [Methylobacteriaceae bacterium]